MTATIESLALARVAASAANTKGGEDVVAVDVSEPLPFVDIFVIASGRSERNVVAIADEIEDQLRAEGVHAVRREGRSEGRWVLIDFGDIVAHVFHPEEREYYALERLWRDCPMVPLRESVSE